MSPTGVVAVVIPIALALVLDAALAELPERVHPVAWFGSLVAAFDREWSRPRVVGLAVAAVLPVLGAAAVALGVELVARASPWAATVAAGLILFATTSLRLLVGTAAEVVAATATDLPTARERLRWLAGRDATDLSASEIRSAAVESAAENLADGLVAPLLTFGILTPISLAAGAGAAAWVKAVNTLDSMLGYPHKPHGAASARLDDVIMWVPARLSAGFVALSALAPGSLAIARQWADAPPSPNSGWPMATLAGVLDARLEKPGVYVLNPDAELPSLESSRRGVRIVGVAGVLAYFVAALLASLLASLLATLLATGIPTVATAEVVAWS
jgi:adenosylcobinamide-phosphate synthase